MQRSSDPKGTSEQLFMAEAARGTLFEFYMMYWREPMYGHLARILGTTQGETLKIKHKLMDLRDEYIHKLWKEHLREEGKEGSPPDKADRERLKTRWRRIRDRLGGRTDERGRKMEDPEETDKWKKRYVAKRCGQWERLLRTITRRLGATQQVLTGWIRLPDRARDAAATAGPTTERERVATVARRCAADRAGGGQREAGRGVRSDGVSERPKKRMRQPGIMDFFRTARQSGGPITEGIGAQGSGHGERPCREGDGREDDPG